MIDRAQGTFIGQVAGDNLGALVEFRSKSTIASQYPEGIREMADGGTWSLMAGQATDDSELALALARSIVRKGAYDEPDVLESYIRWYDSPPFDCGNTVAMGLTGDKNYESQANGALMRISPLGIYCAGKGFSAEVMYDLASTDAAMTHPHRVCRDINRLFVRAIASAVERPLSPEDLYAMICAWSEEPGIDTTVRAWTHEGRKRKPEDYSCLMGHVRIAWINALYQLLHTHSVEDAISDTISEGGDTDTNAAICGALLGSLYGKSSLPESWVGVLTSCRPSSEEVRTHHPRDKEYWPNDILDLAVSLLEAGKK